MGKHNRAKRCKRKNGAVYKLSSPMNRRNKLEFRPRTHTSVYFSTGKISASLVEAVLIQAFLQSLPGEICLLWEKDLSGWHLGNLPVKGYSCKNECLDSPLFVWFGVEWRSRVMPPVLPQTEVCPADRNGQGALHSLVQMRSEEAGQSPEKLRRRCSLLTVTSHTRGLCLKSGQGALPCCSLHSVEWKNGHT